MLSWIIGIVLYTLFPQSQVVADFVQPSVATYANALPVAQDATAVSGPIKRDMKRLGIATTAEASAIVDLESGAFLFGKNANQPHAIASITKLMTALVATEQVSSIRLPVKILKSDVRTGGVEHIAVNDEFVFDDVLHISLISSSNTATAALARASGLSADDFVVAMNAKAVDLGMENTHFVEPTGLDPENRASAKDVAILVRAALEDPLIQKIVVLSDYRTETAAGRVRAVSSTDELLDSFLSKRPYTFLGGKTGYLQEAGYCFGAAAKNADGNGVVAVVLGAASKDQRFKEVKDLLYWTFDAYEWVD
jgi:D-alanyl-D-alanine endopeptidase (penicillin-binding protein 7)